MQFKDTPTNFGIASILFHWVSAVLIIGLFAVGQIMEDMPRGPDKADLMNTHQSVGMILLALVVIRLIWRLTQGFPAPVDTSATFLNKVAHLWHWALLILIIMIPVSGYIASETGFRGVPFFDLFIFPDIIAADHDIHEIFEEVHETLTKILIPLVAIHVLAAFKHHYFDKDDTLKRMIKP